MGETHNFEEVIDKSQLTKRYYTITEVAKMFDVSNSLLRYWEGEFGSLKPTKGRNGIRRYTVNDIEKIDTIYQLVKNRGFTIDGAKKELKKMPVGSGTDTGTIKARLISLRTRLSDLKKQLE